MVGEFRKEVTEEMDINSKTRIMLAANEYIDSLIMMKNERLMLFGIYFLWNCVDLGSGGVAGCGL